MTYEEELEVVSKIKKSLNVFSRNTLNIESIIISEEEYLVCEKHGLDMSKISSVGRGRIAHRMNYIDKIGKIGAHTPREGYYKINRLEKNVNIQYAPFVIENAIWAWYKVKPSDNFVKEEVLINAKPLYNYISVGPKYIELEVDMTIKVNSTTLEESSYKIDWELIDNNFDE